MWQDILAYVIVALAAGLIIWRYCRKLTGKAPACDGGCGCSGSCPSAGGKAQKGRDGLNMSKGPGGGCCG